jgi:hypothetical protein
MPRVLKNVDCTYEYAVCVLGEYLGEFTLNETFRGQGEIAPMDDWLREMSEYELSHSHHNTRAPSSRSIFICSGS